MKVGDYFIEFVLSKLKEAFRCESLLIANPCSIKFATPFSISPLAEV